MGDEVKAFKQPSHLVVIVAFIKTYALRVCVSRTWTFDGNAPEGLSCELEIVLVRPFHYASEG
jgi:hypothetical protein